jgi:hypothetical protein
LKSNQYPEYNQRNLTDGIPGILEELIVLCELFADLAEEGYHFRIGNGIN